MSKKVLKSDWIVLPSGDMIPVAPGYDEDFEDFLPFIPLIAAGVSAAGAAYASSKGKKASDNANAAAERMQKEAIKEEQRKAREAKIQQNMMLKHNFLNDRSKKETIIYGSIGLGVLVLGLVLYFKVFK